MPFPTGLLLAAAWLLAVQSPTPTYEAARSAAITRCDAIDARDYQSGLALNPNGYRSYYVRSQCLQQTAVVFRDLALCDRVRQRRALFSSSWGYSPANCRTLVKQAVESDRAEFAEIRRQYLANSMILRDVRIVRNGNGRDYDAIPSFEGKVGHGYMIAIEIVPSAGRPIAIHSGGYYVDPQSGLYLFIRQQDIRAKLPSFEPGRSYQVRAIATFSLPVGNDSRFMSDAFVEGVFPVAERTRTVTREIRF